MNILITGVAGLIGSRMAKWICENTDHNVIGIDDLSGGYIENIHENVVFFQRNITSEDISDIFKKYKPDIVYHFAAYAAEGLSAFIRKFNYTNNLVGTCSIVNNCIEFPVKRLVFTSSIAVYGSGNPPFNEEQTPCPIDPYGISKYACELDIKSAGEQFGLDWCIIRPHNLYGIHQNIWDKYRNVLGIWMYQFMNNESFLIFGDGEQKRAFTFIDDCLETFWKAGNLESASKQIFNIGSDTAYSVNQANEILNEIVGGWKVSHEEERHEVKDAFPNVNKAKLILNHENKTSLKEGIQKMWEWAKNQPQRNRSEWSKYELNKNFYKSWK
jgi:UDP-glucose 4-epimerase